MGRRSKDTYLTLNLEENWRIQYDGQYNFIVQHNKMVKDKKTGEDKGRVWFDLSFHGDIFQAMKNIANRKCLEDQSSYLETVHCFKEFLTEYDENAKAFYKEILLTKEELNGY